MLTVWVPYDAKVTVNGRETRSTGSRRQFISYGLKPGFSYKYVIRAEVVRNGQPQTDTREVTLTAGEITAVAFGFNTAAAQQVAGPITELGRSPAQVGDPTLEHETGPRNGIWSVRGPSFLVLWHMPICG